MKFIKTPVKGMCDMLPADMRLREHILQMIKTSYASYGFMQIETPVMEHIENLTSKQGGDNEKLIFKVMKRGADLTRAIEAGKQEFADNGLRYDLTVPLARYYANNKEKLPTPFKALQIGNVWRADNPQKLQHLICCHRFSVKWALQILRSISMTDRFSVRLHCRQVLKKRLLVLCLFHWISTTRLALRAFAGN